MLATNINPLRQRHSKFSTNIQDVTSFFNAWRHYIIQVIGAYNSHCMQMTQPTCKKHDWPNPCPQHCGQPLDQGVRGHVANPKLPKFEEFLGLRAMKVMAGEWLELSMSNSSSPNSRGPLVLGCKGTGVEKTLALGQFPWSSHEGKRPPVLLKLMLAMTQVRLTALSLFSPLSLGSMLRIVTPHL